MASLGCGREGARFLNVKRTMVISVTGDPSGCGAGELSVFCQSYFNKTLIDQAGSIGGKVRQEVGVEQRDWEYSGTQEAPSAVLPRPPERKDENCPAPAGKGTEPCANVDKDNGVP